MSSIQILDESTINQIAAGEVVERPKAVVKELVENAIDAGSTAITVEIKEGGLSLIRVTDNGSGIEKEDIPSAFLRHATSKIRTAQDLLTVTSLGFRGEALSSIAAVAQVELITKTQRSLNGYRYITEGGEEKAIEEIGCPDGTTILVRNIFYNTPARRKFLKSPVTEAGYISDLIERLMASHPDVSFKYIINNQVKLQSSGNNNTKDILYHVYGRDITKELLSVEYESEDVKITGYIGKPVINRGNRNFENYFINGRFIKSPVITRAIEEAYKSYLMQHKYPFTSLYFEITPSLIDVNVHPQKMEIRLKNSEEIYSLIFKVIRDTLVGKEMIPKVSLTENDKTKAGSQPSKDKILPEPFEKNRRMQMDALKQKTQNIPLFQVKKEYLSAENQDSSNNVREEADSYSGNLQPKGSSDFRLNSDAGGRIMAEDPSIPHTDITTQTGDTLIPTADTRIQVQESPVPHKDASMPAEDTLIPPTDSATLAKGLSIPDMNETTQAKGSSVNHTDAAMPVRDASALPTEKQGEARNTHIPDPLPVETAKQLQLFENSETEDSAPFLSKEAFDEHRIIGQVFSTFWLVEYKNELFIIDQHAAHEKVLYERIMAAAKEKTYTSQMLMPPIVLSLTLMEQEVLKKHKEQLNLIGYEFEPFGGNEISVRAVPANLYGLSEKKLLLEFIDELTDNLGSNTLSTTSVMEKIASLSCKAAVKANHIFSFEEASALMKELLTLEDPYHCPHGRPVIISMSRYELEKKFKRIV